MKPVNVLEKFEASFGRAPLKSLFVEHPFCVRGRTQSWWSLSPGCQPWHPTAKYVGHALAWVLGPVSSSIQLPPLTPLMGNLCCTVPCLCNICLPSKFSSAGRSGASKLQAEVGITYTAECRSSAYRAGVPHPTSRRCSVYQLNPLCTKVLSPGYRLNIG